MKVKCTNCKKTFYCEKERIPLYQTKEVCDYCFNILKRHDKSKRLAENKK